MPDVAIQVSPLWSWPPKPYAIFRWYFDSWFFLTINLAIVAIAVLSYALFSPEIAQIATFAPGWMALIWLRNAVIVTVLAGIFLLWFHKYARQGTDLKYDPRPFPRKGRMFTLQSQLLDNVFWIIALGVTIWSALECLLWWSMANGYATTITFASNPIGIVAIFFLIPIWGMPVFLLDAPVPAH